MHALFFISSKNKKELSVMEGRKWEDLETDCLIKVFERVGLESLALDIPFVCKSWFKASLNPQCWKILDFSILDDSFEPTFIPRYTERFCIKNFSAASFVKFVFHRSSKSAIDLILPHHWEQEIMEIVTDECPALKNLNSSNVILMEHADYLAKTIGKLNLLEFLNLRRLFTPIEEILRQINMHCKNFSSFTTLGNISNEDARAIAAFLPKVKYLILRGCNMDRLDLILILQGCKELDALDVSNCVGFCIDDEILKLAAHIRNFNFMNASLCFMWEELQMGMMDDQLY